MEFENLSNFLADESPWPDDSPVPGACRDFASKGYLQLPTQALDIESADLEPSRTLIANADWEKAVDPGDGFAGYRRYIPSPEEVIEYNRLVSHPSFLQLYCAFLGHENFEVGGIAINILRPGSRVARHVDAEDCGRPIILSGIIYLEKNWTGEELQIETRPDRIVESLIIPPPTIVLLDPFVPHWQDRITGGEKRSLIFSLFAKAVESRK